MYTRRWWLVVALAIVGGVGLGIAIHLPSDAPGHGMGSHSKEPISADRSYHRIVSLSPSITECLFALHLGDRVVGVTDFCDYPPEALTKSKVGGYYDLNLEAVASLRPDLVVCLPEHADYLVDLDRLGLAHLTVDHRRVEAILESLMTLGKTCGVPERAKELVRDIRQRISVVRKRVVDEKRPRVLMCVGRNMRSPTIEDVYLAGRGGFYDEMITLAGGTNVYEGKLLFPMITGEGLLRLQPEVIVDMVPDLSDKGVTEVEIRRQWESFADLPAVKQGRVFLFTDDFGVVPGPRFIQALEKLADVIHPKEIEP